MSAFRAGVRVCVDISRLGITRPVLRQKCRCQRYMASVCKMTSQSYSTSATRRAEPEERYIQDGACAWADVELPVVSLRDKAIESVEKYGDFKAMVLADRSRSFSFSQLRDAMVHIGSALSRMGFKKGDVIAIVAPNSQEFKLMSLGIIGIGAVVCLINPLHTSDMLKVNFEQTGVVAIVTSNTVLGEVKGAITGNSNIRAVITLDGTADNCRPFSSLLEDDGTLFPDHVDISPKQDPAMIFFSSGTTGFPKAVSVSHYALISNLITGSVANSLEAGLEVIPNYLPLYHLTGCIVEFLMPFMSGAQTVDMLGFDPTKFLSTLEDHKVTQLLVVPPVALFMVKQPSLAQTNLSSIKKTVVGAAPCGTDLCTEYEEKIGTLVQGYGMTESGITHVDKEPVTPGSVGYTFPNTQAKIIDTETGDALGPDLEGEVCLKGPSMMLEYIGNPKATTDMIRDGWVHTGDVGKYDKEGRFYITDRLKELIKYKAFQVAPAELEDVLISHPGIRDAAVIGRPDDEAGELPMACVVLQPNTELSEKEIQEYVAARVSPSSKLRGGVQFVPVVPKSAAGKILRRELRDQFL